MTFSSAIIHALAAIAPFQAMDSEQLQRLYSLTSLKVLAKGDTAILAGRIVDDLCIVVSGRLAEQAPHPDRAEFGQSSAFEADAFFKRGPAKATVIALRESVLLTLAWADLKAAFETYPDLLETCLSALTDKDAVLSRAPSKAPTRLVLCPAGAKGSLDTTAKDSFIAVLESSGDVRILRRDSFGSLALDAPETAHWLQEQELEFDLTVLVADGTDLAFAKEAIDEADEIVFLASSGHASVSALEHYALERRGKSRCRLIIAKDSGISLKNAADWVRERPYRSTQWVDFSNPKDVTLMATALLGKGLTVAATSCGVYAAAILGALQALEANTMPATCLAAAGSAILPAGLLASGASLAETEAAFRHLAEPTPWKKAGKPESGLYEAAPLDSALALAIPDSAIGVTNRPFLAISLSLTDNAQRPHRDGRLRHAIRAGLVPLGVLPPFISEDGEILVSGETEIGALTAAATALSDHETIFLYPDPLPLGLSKTSYRQLAAPFFRLPPFQNATPEKRLRLETLICAASAKPPANLPLPASHCFAVPIAEGIGPLDWQEWSKLRDAAFEWMSAEIEARLAPER